MPVKKGAWQEQWAIIYHYVGLHLRNQVRFPLHRDFWGRCKIGFRWINQNPFGDKILKLGPTPSWRDIESLVNQGHGNTNEWLSRWASEIEGTGKYLPGSGTHYQDLQWLIQKAKEGGEKNFTGWRNAIGHLEAAAREVGTHRSGD